MLLLCAGLVLTLTVPALAAPQFKYNGYYRVRSYYMNNLNLADDSDDENVTAYFDHRFRFQPTLILNDHLSLRARFEAVKNNKWGTQASALNYKAPDRTVNTTETSSVDLARMWMVIKTNYGTFNIGRMITGAYGLPALGYGRGHMTSDFNLGYSFDNMTEQGTVKYTYKQGPLALQLQYIKFAENDYATTASDEDLDTYSAMVTYKWASGSANMAVIYDRDRSDPSLDVDKWHFRPAAIVSFGPITIHAELEYLAGNADPAGGGDSDDIGGLGWNFDVVYSYGPGWVRAAVLWFEAPDADDPTDLSQGQVMRSGWWYPVLIANQVKTSAGLSLPKNNFTYFQLVAEHTLNEMIRLSGSIHYININDPDVYGSDLDSDFGWEFQAGVVLTFWKNLSVVSELAYFTPGGFLEGSNGSQDVGSAYAWVNMVKIDY